MEATIEAVKGMSHPNIVKYEDVFRLPCDPNDLSKGFRLCIRMEKLISLEEYMQSHPMNAQGVARLGIEICSALEACEEKQIIHRDIKPSNILVTQTGEYKLADFGAAHIPTEGRSMTAYRGTPDYMAPEVDARKKDYDATVDTYSLGLTLYHLLYHLEDKQFFKTDELDQRFNGKPLPPLESIDQSLLDIINKACAYEAKNRYPSPKYMREDLQNYLDGKPIFPWKPFLRETEEIVPEPSPPVEDTSEESDDKRSSQSDSSTRPPFPKRLLIAILLIALLFAIGCWFAFCWPPTVDVTEIRLNSPSLEMTIGDAMNQTVTWSSDNPNAASVSNGLVTASGTGTAIITAESGDCTATCTVTVSPPPDLEILPQEVILNLSSLEMTVGNEPFQLNATVLPEDATNRTVTWSSSNSSVASVSNGLVTANKDGTAVIIAESGDCTATCAVIVSPKSPEVIEVKEILVNPTSLGMIVGEEQRLTATVLPENATNQTVTWSSDNPSVASVSGGLVKANGTGKATITAKSGDCTATCTVTVAPSSSTNVKVREVRLNPTSLEMTIGEEQRISATISPENATNQEISWSSSKPSVASVSGGLVKANGTGKATITANLCCDSRSN